MNEELRDDSGPITAPGMSADPNAKTIVVPASGLPLYDVFEMTDAEARKRGFPEPPASGEPVERLRIEPDDPAFELPEDEDGDNKDDPDVRLVEEQAGEMLREQGIHDKLLKRLGEIEDGSKEPWKDSLKRVSRIRENGPNPFLPPTWWQRLQTSKLPREVTKLVKAFWAMRYALPVGLVMYIIASVFGTWTLSSAATILSALAGLIYWWVVSLPEE